MIELARLTIRCVDRFLFSACEPSVCALFRISYSILMIVNVAVWMLDGPLWFSGEGVLGSELAARLEDPPGWSLLFYLPDTPLMIHVSLALMMVQSCCLLFGCWSRFQIACLFVWLTSFHHRNPLICDGEDTVFRLFAFIMIFMPLDARWSIRARRTKNVHLGQSHCWALRLIQAEMAVLYASSAWSKFQGSMWHDGTALFGVSQMTDYYGRGWIPSFVFQTPNLAMALSWSVIILEAALPLTLWFSATRRIAIFAGIGFHLALEYSMNLFLFEWLMIVGLLSFSQPSDWTWWQTMIGRGRWVRTANGTGGKTGSQ